MAEVTVPCPCCLGSGEEIIWFHAGPEARCQCTFCQGSGSVTEEKAKSLSDPKSQFRHSVDCTDTASKDPLCRKLKF